MSAGQVSKVYLLSRIYKIRTAVETLPGYSREMKQAAKEHLDKVLDVLDEFRY